MIAGGSTVFYVRVVVGPNDIDIQVFSSEYSCTKQVHLLCSSLDFDSCDIPAQHHAFIICHLPQTRSLAIAPHLLAPPYPLPTPLLLPAVHAADRDEAGSTHSRLVRPAMEGKASEMALAPSAPRQLKPKL